MQTPHKIKVVIPVRPSDKELGDKAAWVHRARAGMDCHVEVVVDEKLEGWVKMHNKTFRASNNAFYVYSCADYFPGVDWLKIAFEMMQAKSYGLIGFNDGKWHGGIATVGLVRRSWAENNYDGDLFFSEYHSHFADTEITILAKEDKAYGYNPDAVLIEIDYNKEGQNISLKDRMLFNKRGYGRGRFG